ncbi:MAG: dihydropteroate synthase [Deltaproteobacteria bacterium]|nr:dihydropteroate synthase [Deltaproteobacteria bacterium]
MIFIGEGINGLNPAVRRALLERDRPAVQRLARLQAEAGAAYLDLHVGTAWPRPAQVMAWLVETAQEAVGTPLALDSNRLDVVRAGLKVCRSAVMINAATGEREKLPAFMALAVEHGASLVVLTMDERGIPQHAVGRLAIAKRILDCADEHGLPRDRLFLDPVLLPMKFSQSQGPIVLEAIRGIRLEKDPPHAVLGLSNGSQGTKERGLINRTLLVMAMACGLDAVIADVLDVRLREAAAAAEVILENQPYSDQFLSEVRQWEERARSG